MKTATLALVLLLCVGCSSVLPHESYVQADRETYNLVAPIIENAADGDASNGPNYYGANAHALRLKLKTWLIRIEAAEEAVRNAR